jgi:phosphate transport system substrate-binding protein
VAVGLALVLGAAACGGDDETSNGSGAGATIQKLGGDVRIDGSSTVYPLTEAAAELFMEEQPYVRVTVGQSGTGGGFEKFCNGKTNISDASRPIKDEEKAKCEAKGITYEDFHVANDAITVVVNKDVDFTDCLTVAQLKKIWEPKSKVNNWNRVDPKFPNKPLKLFGPGKDSGTFDFFTKEINGEEDASRTDYSPSEDDNVIVQGVSSTPGGLGYFGYTYYGENQDKLNAMKIDGGGGCVAPSPEGAQDGTYKPLSRPLFIYPSASALSSKPQVLAFVEYYVANADKIAEEGEFISLNDAQKTELQADLERLKSGAGGTASPSPSG